MKSLLVAAMLTAGLPAGLMAGPCLIVVDHETGHILEARDANARVPVASLTKLATALVVLDMAELRKLNLSEVVMVPPAATRAGGVNPVGLAEGDALTLRDLLYCALLASDNISAATLAHHAGSRLPNPQGLSPIDNFVTHMNALARSLEMKRTLFLNPTGLDSDPESDPPYSTAADMARLTRYAYKDADLPYYVSQRSREVHVFRAGQGIPVQLTNTNGLVGQMGIDGVKTGRTARAGDCLILSSEQRPEVKREGSATFVTPRRIHIVLLRSANRFAEGLELTRRGWGLYGRWAERGRKSSGSNTL